MRQPQHVKGMAMNDYFSDREIGQRPRSEQTISPDVWKALAAIITTRLNTGALGYRFPSICPDGNAVVDVDVRALADVLRAEIPGLDWPLQTTRFNDDSFESEPWAPDTLQVLDLLEFVHKSVAKPLQGSYHDYFKHHHLTFDVDAGQSEFRDDVNRIFARNGLAYEFTRSGQIQRTLPPVLDESLRNTTFRTGDHQLDVMLEECRTKFASPDARLRREAIERLWDAWERLKTTDGADKKLSIAKILDRAADEQTFRKMLDDEAKQLTSIGNTFHIRHSETTQIHVTDPDQVDYLFHRLFAMIQLLLRKNRAG